MVCHTFLFHHTNRIHKRKTRSKGLQTPFNRSIIDRQHKVRESKNVGHNAEAPSVLEPVAFQHEKVPADHGELSGGNLIGLKPVADKRIAKFCAELDILMDSNKAIRVLSCLESRVFIERVINQ